MVMAVDYGRGDWSSNPGQDRLSHSANTLGNVINPNILLLTIVEQTGFLKLDMATGLGEGKL